MENIMCAACSFHSLVRQETLSERCPSAMVASRLARPSPHQRHQRRGECHEKRHEKRTTASAGRDSERMESADDHGSCGTF